MAEIEIPPPIDEDEDDLPSDEEEGGDTTQVTFTRGGRRQNKRGKGNEHEPVLNAQSVPLFPDMDKDSRHVVVGLDVYKLTMPDEGFRGRVPPSSTLEAIGRRFGNGRYNIHAVNQAGRTLRRREDIPIALDDAPKRSAGPTAPMVSPDMTLLNFQAQQHERDSARIETFAKESTAQNREMTQSHLKMVQAQAESQTTRDRAFFEAQHKQQGDFFAGVLGFMQQAHSNLMAQQSAQFQQTILMMEQGHQRALAASDPTTLLTIFQQGMTLGREAGGEGDQNPVIEVGKTLLGGMSEVRKMMMLKHGVVPSNLALPGGTGQKTPGKQGPKVGSPETLPQTKAPANAQNPALPAAEESQADTIARLMRIKALLEKQGEDFTTYLADVEAHLSQLLQETAGNKETPANEPEPTGESTPTG